MKKYFFIFTIFILAVSAHSESFWQKDSRIIIEGNYKGIEGKALISAMDANTGTRWRRLGKIEGRRIEVLFSSEKEAKKHLKSYSWKVSPL